MADKEAAPKKKGKMPIMIVAALVVGGGGFFMMKPKGKEDHSVKPAKEVVSMGELTVNLKDNGVYLKFTAVLVPRLDYSPELLTHSMDAIKNYLVCKMPDYSLAQTRTFEGKKAIQKQIAEGINDLLPDDPKMINPTEPKKGKGKGKGAHEENRVVFVRKGGSDFAARGQCCEGRQGRQSSGGCAGCAGAVQRRHGRLLAAVHIFITGV